MNRLDNTQILFAFALVAAAILVSYFAKFRLEKSFAIAALRSAVQLSLIGYLLRFLFSQTHFLFDLLILVVMTLAAGQIVVTRLKKKSWRLYWFSLLSLFAGIWPVGFLCSSYFFGPQSLSDAKFFVPLMGLLLGNALSAISLTFLQIQKIRVEDLGEIETFKSLGGTGFESARRLYREALHQSLNPILNAMSVVGIVSLPGAMAGQVLGGVDPVIAGRMQILIMFMLLLTSFIGSFVGLMLQHFFEMPSWIRHENDVDKFAKLDQSVVCLYGPSGVGKTRLLKSMAGLDEKAFADNVFKNSSIKREASERRNLIYTRQSPEFVPGSVRENLELPFSFRLHRGQRFDEARAKSHLEQFGLSADLLESPTTQLSGGERQLVSLVRTLLLEPETLLLDEPTASLDPARTRLVETFIAKWVRERGGRAVIFVSHDPEQRQRISTEQFELTSGGLIHA